MEYVAEIKKPASERLSGFQEAALQTLKYQLFSPAPVYPEFEKIRLAASLKFALGKLGADDPFVKSALEGRSPEQVATEVIGGTKLADPAFRKQLIEGGQSAVDASTDALIVFERSMARRWLDGDVKTAVHTDSRASHARQIGCTCVER